MPPHTYFWPTHSPGPGPPASAQSQLLGSGRQCGGGGAPKLGAGFHSTFHPVLPTGCRFPKGSSFSICLPTVCPQPGITVIVRLEKHLLCTPLTDQHNFRDEWDYRSHFTDEETGTRELARLPGLELPAGFSQRETQAGQGDPGRTSGRRRAFRSGAWLCASAQGYGGGCLAAPPTALGCNSFKKLTLAHSFRSRDGNCSPLLLALGGVLRHSLLIP